MMNDRQRQEINGPPAAVSGSARASRAGFGASPKPTPHSLSAILSTIALATVEALATADAPKLFLVLVLDFLLKT